MKDGAMMLGEIAFARGTVELAPGAPIGMAVGTEIAQPEPAAIATASMGTKVPRGVHRAGTPVGRGYGVGSYGRGRFGMCRFLRTQGTRGLVRQARKRCGVGGALAARRDGLGWLWLGRHVWAGPGEVQHDKQPQESQDHELIVKLMWNHGKKPPHNGMVGGHCTRFSGRDNYPQRRGTRPFVCRLCQLCLTIMHPLCQELLPDEGCVEFGLEHIDEPL